jgi:hypothetical protein
VKIDRRGVTALMLAAGLAGGMGIAQAKTVRLSATLHPVAGVKTSGTGAMHGTFNTVTRRVTWDVTYSHLTSKVIMAHFHGPISTPGQNAPVQVWLTKKPPHPMPVAPIRGSTVLSKVQAKELMGGHWYVMIHTVMHKPGELRGRVHAG